jgi:hypothetical protein
MRKSRIAYLADKRQRLAAEYAVRRRQHRERAGTARKLKTTTTELLAAELRAQAHARELAEKAAKAAASGSLRADLDLFAATT